jgi:hypothetical protein
MSFFAYKAINDELSLIAETDVLVQRHYGVSANILYQRNTMGGHLAEGIKANATALALVTAVLDGSYSKLCHTTGCTIQNVTIAIDTSPG